MLLNQGYVPCNKQIHIKIPENELQMIHDRMEKIGVKNMSAYIRKMAIDCCLLFYFPQIGTSFGKLKEASPRTK